MAVEAYFAYGPTLAGMVNLETAITTPASTFPGAGGAPMPLMGSVGRPLLSQKLDRSGAANGALAFPAMGNGQDDLNALTLALFGDYGTPSKRLYIITWDTTGAYSPFLCDVYAPYFGDNFTYGVNAVPNSIIVPLRGGILQSATKTSDYTLATSDGIIYANTAGGNINITLFAASAIAANVSRSFVKTSAANTLTITRAGSDKIDGANTKTATALYSRIDIVSDHSANWTSI